MNKIETKDIQGIILRGYGKLPEACYALLRFTNSALAKSWLNKLGSRLTTGEKENERKSAINFSFTYEGLKFIGLNQSILDTFPLEIQEGMATTHRSSILGDYNKSCPSKWLWGNDSNKVHALLMIFATDRKFLESIYENEQSKWKAFSVELVQYINAPSLLHQKEHFGFNDGISQPEIEELMRDGSNKANAVPAGEFILGYKNAYGLFSESPSVNVSIMPEPEMLSQHPLKNQCKDLGHNGSYMIFRQLKQDVKKFWGFIEKTTKINLQSEINTKACVALASKMVGRWPSGAPLSIYPDHDPIIWNEKDIFQYSDDKYGRKCPIGAHIRRANPRDMKDDDPIQALKINNRHRILRRGRSYGKPLIDSMQPKDLINATEDRIERGLNFICFNTNISRQFEFIQQTWINNFKFSELYDESDPILGKPDLAERGLRRNFSYADQPIRRRIRDLPSFVETRGGAYFFTPGIRAFKFIAGI